MKNLKDILYKAGITNVTGSTDIEVNSVCFDSRKVKQGDLFIAVKGINFNGHSFINQAIENGAIVIVCEDLPSDILNEITYIKVNDSSYALGVIASNYYNNPSSKIQLIGVTGTNGKTTIVSLLYNLFCELGYKAGLLSTIKNKIDNEDIPATHTTPDAIQINDLLCKMLNKGCSYCFMEVSSHSIVQNRIAGLEFTGGIFTNITHDHLDYHNSFDEYLKVKKRFFDTLPAKAFALSNIDDKNGIYILQNTKAAKKTYSLKTISDFKCKIIENQFEGLQLNIDGIDIWCKLIGRFNAYNLLATYAAAVLLGEDKSKVLITLSNLDSIDGRFEFIKSRDNIIAIIDYAHTPDALKNVLDTIGTIRTRNEQLITVIGAGGDRDKKKRPVMTQIACEKSDKVILTSDNPRSEDPELIIEEMKKGVEPLHFKKVLSITDRKEAIKTACMLAKAGDIILVGGKGHEKFQEIKGVKYPFDDKKIVRQYIQQ
ncbi:MAG: UDP-N-acetylmuramoyl-L-alanyl-D-glutamate--2,6-diaminopimelate ligase [Bacteroidales bacterium]|nr:UDP-N-acetylmuramoyl-L-alanyl-D-glutamate--2,6-diaminopimelate ligase [Bacteroidales bacterium]